MRQGILAGQAWALETILLGAALSQQVFSGSSQIMFLAPFVAAFLHDCFSALWMLLYDKKKNYLREDRKVLKRKDTAGIVLAAAMGGPVGMSGYLLSIANLGPAIGAGVSAVYPAIGAVLAFVFLKEKMKWHRWCALLVTILGVYGLGYTAELSVQNIPLGITGAFLCAFGWGMEGVIIAKCVRKDSVSKETALLIRQTTSAILYGVIILPALRGWKLLKTLVMTEPSVLMFIGVAAFFATASYLFYYKAIGRIGVSGAMALNISYVAWTGLFSLIFLHDTSILYPGTLVCTCIVIAGSLATAYRNETDAKDDNRV